MRMVIILSGCFHFFLGDGFSLGGVAPPLGRACLPKKGLSPPTEGSQHPHNLHKIVKSYFDSSSVFVEYFGLNII